MGDVRRTKWSILEAQADALERQAADIRAGMAAMWRIQIYAQCPNCGEVLVTEADFARHFTVPDPRYLNLGDCPDK